MPEELARKNRKIINKLLKKLTGSFVIEVGAGDNTLVVDSDSRVGVGTASPSTILHVYHATDNVALRLQTDKTDGQAQVHLVNDVQAWHIRCATNDTFAIRDDVGSKNVVVIEAGAAANSLRIDSNGHVGCGTSNPAASAQVEISSTTGALLLSRMTTGQRDALTAVNGMVIYNSTTTTIQGYTNGSWTSL